MWLLKHFEPCTIDPSLAGDLLEQYRRGRSRTWYWRQAVTAIVIGYCREMARGTVFRCPS